MYEGPTNGVPWLVENIVIFQIRLENTTFERVESSQSVRYYTVFYGVAWSKQRPKVYEWMCTVGAWVSPSLAYHHRSHTLGPTLRPTLRLNRKRFCCVLAIHNTLFIPVQLCGMSGSSRAVSHWFEHAIEEQVFLFTCIKLWNDDASQFSLVPIVETKTQQSE